MNNVYGQLGDSGAGAGAFTPGGSAVPLPGEGSGHRRTVSLNAGQSPLGRPKTLSNESGGAGTYYEPSKPAHLGSGPYTRPHDDDDEDFYHRDRITDANTFANGVGSRPPSSSALSYLTQP
jgi:hypothetical protein